MRSDVKHSKNPIVRNGEALKAKQKDHDQRVAKFRKDLLLDHDPADNKIALSEQAEAAIRRPYGKNTDKANNAVKEALAKEVTKAAAVKEAKQNVVDADDQSQAAAANASKKPTPPKAQVEPKAPEPSANGQGEEK